ncbi:hypothetical protein [Streptomyces monashensis]|uniref:Uncharacterized protein n=1 Tax=Streptomyces monashensis TaxID=1678012 RepID=A0A1S2Q9E9_9ACTN|nr:hypothetical protein [Streptomyces monashensis]OIK02241.1 hypothetical protein BIV23_25700 [Streptomyces monashensis]
MALIEAGIGTDVFGVRRECLPPGLADEVHVLLPRQDLAYALSAAIITQAEAKPPASSPPVAMVSDNATLAGVGREPVISTSTEILRRRPDGGWVHVVDAPFIS